MTLDRPLICTLCARGGSKGVPGKNTRLLAGKPLFVHSLDQAKATGLFHTIAVSSDDPELLTLAEANGALAVVRPPELATDTAAKLPAIRHCLAEAERRTGEMFAVLVDLDATSPLRDVADITACVDLLRATGAGNVITGAPARRSPYFNLVEARADGSVGLSKPPAQAVVRRQDAPKTYDMNASIYVWRGDVFREDAAVFRPDTRLHVMPEERSVDIDSEIDWLLVELLMARKTPA